MDLLMQGLGIGLGIAGAWIIIPFAIALTIIALYVIFVFVLMVGQIPVMLFDKVMMKKCRKDVNDYEIN